MNRSYPLIVIFLVGLVLVLAGCGGKVEREGTPTPITETPTLQPTPLPTATATPTLFPSPTPTPTPTSPPTPTPTPMATMSPSPSPTITPTPTPLLLLEVLGPADGSTVPGDAVVVFGNTTGLATLTINGEVIPLEADGRFQAEVGLSPGINEIEVIATAGFREERIVLTVTSLGLPPQPFFLLVTEPKDQSIVSQGTIPLTGRTAPGAVVTVNGVGVGVDPLGIFSTTVTLDEGPNTIEVVATNSDGEQLSAIIAVIFRP